ncbi:pupal cuticle protein 36-like [Penaeus monodon]|uniref:pupal cuticle protein 36-like n=1 Tax=Penaeus monodon TaxID=6687 RepID=UPI0018A6D6D2|nr:pupal cuticle protein 36-like [Penaeus monodon]
MYWCTDKDSGNSSCGFGGGLACGSGAGGRGGFKSGAPGPGNGGFVGGAPGSDFSFVADENGFRVESDLLPTPPPLPPHAIAQIEKARQEDAAAAASGGRPNSGSGQFPGSGFGAGQSGFGSSSGQF